jgi:hypothetical protein
LTLALSAYPAGPIAFRDRKVSVEGVHAATQLTGPAIFYFYFEKQQSGFGLSGAPSSTDQFKLLRFEVKKSSREAVVMQSNGFRSSTGVPGKDAVGSVFHFKVREWRIQSNRESVSWRVLLYQRWGVDRV